MHQKTPSDDPSQPAHQTSASDVDIAADSRQDAGKRHDGQFHPSGDKSGVLNGSEHLQGQNPRDYTDDRNTIDGQVIKGRSLGANGRLPRFAQLKER